MQARRCGRWRAPILGQDPPADASGSTADPDASQVNTDQVPADEHPAEGARLERRPTAPDGIVVVDKPAGWTSHDVVARMRTLAGTRRVGHAGTLDPMATGVLVVGIGRATRLLGHISGADKTYTATVRLGWATVTDDAEGERLAGPEQGPAAADLSQADVQGAIGGLTGTIMQRPATVSAIKVDGRRSHERVRAGEQIELAERPVTVSGFDLLALRRDPAAGTVDLDVAVTCSAGTYVRALARDLGDALGVGGHLTALRRTRVGGFALEQARTLEECAHSMHVTPMAQAAREAFDQVVVSAADANSVRYGRPIDLSMAWPRTSDPEPPGKEVPPRALFAADGEFLALAIPRPDGSTKYLAVFSQP